MDNNNNNNLIIIIIIIIIIVIITFSQNKLQIRDKKIDKKSLFTKFKMIAWIVQ